MRIASFALIAALLAGAASSASAAPTLPYNGPVEPGTYSYSGTVTSSSLTGVNTNDPVTGTFTVNDLGPIPGVEDVSITAGGVTRNLSGLTFQKGVGADGTYGFNIAPGPPNADVLDFNLPASSATLSSSTPPSLTLALPAGSMGKLTLSEIAPTFGLVTASITSVSGGPAAVPEPTSLALLGAGALVLAGCLRRRAVLA